MVNLGNQKAKFFLGNQKVKLMSLGNQKVYSSGNNVTYMVNGVAYVEEVEEGKSALIPTSFEPVLADAQFLGWSDSPTSTDTLKTKIMGDEPFTLYAVFKYNNLVVKQSGAGGRNLYSSTYYYDTNKYERLNMTSMFPSGNPKDDTQLSHGEIQYANGNVLLTDWGRTSNIDAYPSSDASFKVCAMSGYINQWVNVTMTYYGKKVVG